MPYLESASQLLPFQSQSETSREAAVEAKAFRGQQAAAVYAWFVAQGPQGGTQREASEALAINRASMAPRVNELAHDGRLVKTTTRRAGCAVYLPASLLEMAS